MFRGQKACALAGAVALCCFAGAASAQDYPTKPIHLVVGFSPGGINDIVARTIGESLSTQFEQPVIVENRTGAGGTLGAAYVAEAPPDGYTIFLGSVSNLAIAPGQYPELPYDPLQDFAPITLVAAAPNILVVNPTSEIESIVDLITKARENPDEINYASAGLGTSNHLTVELLQLLSGIDLVHIPYQGDHPATSDVVAGHVPMTFSAMPVALPFIQSGKLRPVAVSSKERSEFLPDVPTVAESGGPADFEVSVWVGLVAPAGTPGDIVNELALAVEEAVEQPEVREQLKMVGVEPDFRGPAEFREYLSREIATWGKLAKREP